MVQSVVKILAVEDQAVGLEAPDDVGKRPKENSNKGKPNMYLIYFKILKIYSYMNNTIHYHIKFIY